MGVSDEVRMPLAVGTSLTIIIRTSIESYRGHKARAAVDDVLLKAWAVPIIAGVLIGAQTFPRAASDKISLSNVRSENARRRRSFYS